MLGKPDLTTTPLRIHYVLKLPETIFASSYHDFVFFVTLALLYFTAISVSHMSANFDISSSGSYSNFVII